MSELIDLDKVKARHFHSTKRFIDDLCALNDGGEFGRVYKDIYPNELELKVEHSGSHASFLNLDITIKEGLFVNKLFDKRDYIWKTKFMCFGEVRLRWKVLLKLELRLTVLIEVVLMKKGLLF